jgi:hypothetical protein
VKGQRLFVSALGDHTAEVLDLRSARRVRTLSGLEEPQGQFYDPAPSRLFVACGGNGVTNVYDGTTFKILASVKFPDDADNVPRQKRKEMNL